VKLGEDPPHEFVCAGFLEWTPNYFDRKHKAGKSLGDWAVCRHFPGGCCSPAYCKS